MSQQVSSRKPFGLPTNARPLRTGDITLRWQGGEGPYRRSEIKVGGDLIDKWKAITSKTSHDHAGQPDKEGKRRVLSRVEVLGPGYVCSETYIVLGAFETKKEADNLASYVKTRFVRFLVSLLSFSQDITKERFAYVPLQDFSKKWTDPELYKYYGIASEEAKFIESVIRPMDNGDAS